MRIIGVDFSGAGSDDSVGKTWMAQGCLEGNTLTLDDPNPISRSKLTKKLADLKEPAVVAMDFPFSVPVAFANHWQKCDVLANGWEMPRLWAAAANLAKGRKGFDCLVDDFVRYHGAIKRLGDPPQSLSPLNKSGINMVPMTFQGMKMLNSLWKCSTIKVSVPPLSYLSPCGEVESVTLLEVMPGMVLNRLGVNYRKYKGGKKEAVRSSRKEQRREILSQLKDKSAHTAPVEVILSKSASKVCHKDQEGDALDAVVAAIAAALWHKEPGRFSTPPEQGCPGRAQVLLEGWLYSPKGCCPQCGNIPPAVGVA